MTSGISAESARAAGRALRLEARPVFLAGREKVLTELEARLSGDDGARPRVVALCGLGGAGKTSLAVEYAYRRAAGRLRWPGSYPPTTRQ